MAEIEARNITIGEKYRLVDSESNRNLIGDDWDVRFDKLLKGSWKATHKYATQPFAQQFAIFFDDESGPLRYTIFAPGDLKFQLAQKSLSNVYKNKGTEFGVRNTFERIGVTGYTPAANTIVKQATGVKYTPNPYQRKSRKNNLRKKAKSRKVNKRR